MYHLIYVSSAVKELSEDELLDLLEEARARNLRQGVTGMLLYLGGNFIQVLEGEQEDVEDIYRSIAQDSRHSGLIVIEQEEISGRSFPDWSMGFKYLSKLDRANLPGYSGFLDSGTTLDVLAGHSAEVVQLLYSFKNNMN